MKIGIFGGSFNPPHKIHKEIATYLVNNNYLDINKVFNIIQEKLFIKLCENIIFNNLKEKIIQTYIKYLE